MARISLLGGVFDLPPSRGSRWTHQGATLTATAAVGTDAFVLLGPERDSPAGIDARTRPADLRDGS